MTRLTYSKNIQRCLSIHAGTQTAESLSDSSRSVQWQELVQCIEHNTDKVDRRFFGYYNNQKMKLVNKYWVE